MAAAEANVWPAAFTMHAGNVPTAFFAADSVDMYYSKL